MQTSNLGPVLEHKIDQRSQACAKDGKTKLNNFTKGKL